MNYPPCIIGGVAGEEHSGLAPQGPSNKDGLSLGNNSFDMSHPTCTIGGVAGEEHSGEAPQDLRSLSRSGDGYPSTCGVADIVSRMTVAALTLLGLRLGNLIKCTPYHLCNS